jgi:hypothetical protein
MKPQNPSGRQQPGIDTLNPMTGNLPVGQLASSPPGWFRSWQTGSNLSPARESKLVSSPHLPFAEQHASIVTPTGVGTPSQR